MPEEKPRTGWYYRYTNKYHQQGQWQGPYDKDFLLRHIDGICDKYPEKYAQYEVREINNFAFASELQFIQVPKTVHYLSEVK